MTRHLAMTLRTDFFDPQAAVDPSAYQLLPMQITTAVYESLDVVGFRGGSTTG